MLNRKKLIFILIILVIPLMGFTKLNVRTSDTKSIVLSSNQFDNSNNRIDKLITKYNSVFITNDNISKYQVIKRDVFINESDRQKTEKVRIRIVQLAEYYFMHDGKVKKGKIYGNSDTSVYKLNSKIKEIQHAINTNEMEKERTTSNYIRNANISKANLSNRDWKEQEEWKNYYILNYEGVHYADYSEWVTTYQLSDFNGNNYYTVVYESYIKPDEYKTDFRTNYLIYKFNPNYGSKALLRDYGPKMKNPNETVTFSVGGGIEIKKTASVGPTGPSVGISTGASASLSKSWTTLIESPKIFDNGNMGQNYAEIKFDYYDPYADSDKFYEYNISQTNQNAAFVIKAPSYSQKPIKIKSDRILGIVRDGFWSNTEAEFVLDDNWITIYNYKQEQLIRPSDFASKFVNSENKGQYFFETKTSEIILDNGFSFNTTRLRCSYILDKYLVLSANRENAGKAFIEYNFNKIVKEISINLSLWSPWEHLYNRESKIIVEKKNSWGEWETIQNINVFELSFVKSLSDLFIFKDIYSKDIRITVLKNNPFGNRNTGRVVIGDMIVKH